MYRGLLFFLVMLFIACAAGGCASKSRGNYEELQMPLQTGSVLHRRIQVPTGPKEKSKTKKKEKTAKPKPEAQPSATPNPEEENTPSPDRFR
jgi:hypothetical protein